MYGMEPPDRCGATRLRRTPTPNLRIALAPARRSNVNNLHQIAPRSIHTQECHGTQTTPWLSTEDSALVLRSTHLHRPGHLCTHIHNTQRCSMSLAAIRQAHQDPCIAHPLVPRLPRCRNVPSQSPTLSTTCCCCCFSAACFLVAEPEALPLPSTAFWVVAGRLALLRLDAVGVDLLRFASSHDGESMRMLLAFRTLALPVTASFRLGSNRWTSSLSVLMRRAGRRRSILVRLLELRAEYISLRIALC